MPLPPSQIKTKVVNPEPVKTSFWESLGFKSKGNVTQKNSD